MLPPEQQKRFAAKPSLLSPTSATEQGGEEGVRILNAPSPSRSSTVSAGSSGRSKKLAAIAFVLVAIAGAATLLGVPDTVSGMLGKNEIEPVAAKVPSTLASNAAAARPTAQPAPPVIIPTPAVAPEANTAAIITDETSTAKAVASVKTDQPDNLTSALEAGIKPHPASLKTALEASAVPAKSKPAPRAPLVNRVATVKSTEQPAHAAKLPAKAPSGDSDVSLIAALVAHDIEHGAKPKPAASSKSVKIAAAKSGAKTKGGLANEKAELQPVRESSAAQLEKCHAQDFVDAEMCRWRVCSGKWDTDPACKVK